MTSLNASVSAPFCTRFAIIAFHETTLSASIFSKTADAFSKQPNLAYISNSELAMKISDSISLFIL
uniref:Uncharacterized protein n=1 Tax=Arundo donax TaxID=35708 RepID=A0A0A9CZ00_ARUDO